MSKPNRTSYDRASTIANGVDSVYLTWITLGECNAFINPNGGGDCDIWISVYGYSNTSYTVTAQTIAGGNVTSMLLDGVPQTGQVARTGYVYYYAPVMVQPGQPFSVYVRPITGDPDVYIRTDGQMPSRTFYQASSTRAGGDEIINIGPNARFYNATCTFTIAVYGFTAATYQITFFTSTAVIQLAAGVSQVSQLLRTRVCVVNPARSRPTLAPHTRRSRAGWRGTGRRQHVQLLLVPCGGSRQRCGLCAHRQLGRPRHLHWRVAQCHLPAQPRS